MTALNSNKYMLAHKIPSKAVFNITLRCQLKCKICTIISPYPGCEELETAKIFAVLEDLAKSGIVIIDFVGGEILLRDDAIEILKFARHLFKEVNIVTNGMVELEDADVLLSLPVDNITISFDGSNSATHDTIRGTGVFDKVMNFMQYLKSKKPRDKKPYTIINTVILKNNFLELVDILKLADSMHFNSITYQVYLSNNADLKRQTSDSPFWIRGKDLLLLEEQVKAILEIKREKCHTIYIANTEIYLENIVNYYADNLTPDLFTCRNGLDFITIRSDGDVGFCNFTVGNVVDENILDIWHKQKTQQALRSILNCRKPCMMNCMVGAIDDDKTKLG